MPGAVTRSTPQAEQPRDVIFEPHSLTNGTHSPVLTRDTYPYRR